MESKPLEAWFVTGSQNLYGEETLRQVAENSRRVVEGLNASVAAAGPRRVQAGGDHPGVDLAGVPRGQRRAELHRRDLLDAHVFAGEDVDRRPRRAAEADGPSAHAVQPRSALGHDRHGLHEPEPGGPRRPRVRLHLHADGQAAQGDRRPLAGRRGAGPPGGVAAGRRRDCTKCAT